MWGGRLLVGQLREQSLIVMWIGCEDGGESGWKDPYIFLAGGRSLVG